MTKLYVGITNTVPRLREVFRSESMPTNESHGKTYVYCIGPFRTKLAAEYMKLNPHCETVADAEYLSKPHDKLPKTQSHTFNRRPR